MIFNGSLDGLGGFMTDIVFDFLADSGGVDLSVLAVSAYNLALCYFYWDVFKFMFNFLRFIFRRYHK